MGNYELNFEKWPVEMAVKYMEIASNHADIIMEDGKFYLVKKADSLSHTLQ